MHGKLIKTLSHDLTCYHQRMNHLLGEVLFVTWYKNRCFEGKKYLRQKQINSLVVSKQPVWRRDTSTLSL